MRARPSRKAVDASVGFLAICALAGCAASSREARYEQALGRAQASVGQARRAGAYEEAAQQLTTAMDKLDEAKRVSGHGHKEQATRLLEEAAVDADLAAATAQNRKIQDALADVQASVETLREEIDRDD